MDPPAWAKKPAARTGPRLDRHYDVNVALRVDLDYIIQFAAEKYLSADSAKETDVGKLLAMLTKILRDRREEELARILNDLRLGRNQVTHANLGNEVLQNSIKAALDLRPHLSRIGAPKKLLDLLERIILALQNWLQAPERLANVAPLVSKNPQPKKPALDLRERLASLEKEMQQVSLEAEEALARARRALADRDEVLAEIKRREPAPVQSPGKIIAVGSAESLSEPRLGQCWALKAVKTHPGKKVFFGRRVRVIGGIYDGAVGTLDAPNGTNMTCTFDEHGTRSVSVKHAVELLS